jgi:hypothetical protein
VIIFSKQGILTCAFCGSLLVQTGEVCKCINLSCENNLGKHPDTPVEQSKAFAGWINRGETIATASVYQSSGTSV